MCAEGRSDEGIRSAGRGPSAPARLRALTPDRVRTWFYSDATSAAVAWFAAVVVLVAVLGWFFVLSPYGAPASPVYAEF
ncbi:hypothetical protein [Collinsella intestinalis]|uniref:Uncharacterized protein n=1 Tax=Collinsella intestinalis TaxID=147207 RepID=A0A414NFC7_9ACTN|nr:hypothetical protein [Collinsella intestinalis]RHF38503.1 hypothetical protein DW682_02015 [Collinsella intestinalis]